MLHRKTVLKSALIGIIVSVSPRSAFADVPDLSPASDHKKTATHPLSTAQKSATEKPVSPSEQIHVMGHMDQARGRIFPALGAVSYGIDEKQIQATPQGQNATFSQIMLRLPGVVQDSYGEVHVRGEHGGLTYRVNGVLLPEGLNGFGQELDTRIIQSMNLLTGTLPAQFGFRTAGIVDVNTKSGSQLKHNQLSLYGGSYQTFAPSLQLGGHKGNFEYFTTVSYNRNAIGIENPTNSFRPVHDLTEQEKAFGYFSWHPDDANRLSLLTSASYSDFEIPNTPGLPQLYAIEDADLQKSAVQSRFLRDSQTEQNYYAVVSWQHTQDGLNFQASPFFRYGRIDYTPDPIRDLAFQGVSEHEVNDFTTGGMQFDLSWSIARHHTLRAGVLGQYTSERLDTNSLVFLTGSEGQQLSATPQRIIDNSGNWSVEAGAYLQDEYKITHSLTFNYGIRYDRFASSFDNEGQLSPRANLVWKPFRNTTFHIGYSRYFARPPRNTSIPRHSPVSPERPMLQHRPLETPRRLKNHTTSTLVFFNALHRSFRSLWMRSPNGRMT